MTTQNNTDKKKVGNPNFINKWNLGKTKPIRVPILLADQLVELARKLDDNNITKIPQFKNSNDVNFKEIKIKILKSLKLGSQSATYKKVDQALSQFIKEIS